MAYDEFDDGWPKERLPARDTRVVGPVLGAANAISRRLELSTREHGLDASEALVLQTVLRDANCAPWQVRSQTGLHRSTLSSILDRLERDGRIERRRSQFDGRRFEIDLTTAGLISAQLAEFVSTEVEAEIVGYTSRSERYGARAVFEACQAIGRRERGVTD